MKKFEKILRHRGHMGASFGVGPCSRKILAAREIIICEKKVAWPGGPGGVLGGRNGAPGDRNLANFRKRPGIFNIDAESEGLSIGCKFVRSGTISGPVGRDFCFGLCRICVRSDFHGAVWRLKRRPGGPNFRRFSEMSRIFRHRCRIKRVSDRV